MKIAFFSTKSYDKQYFDLFNEGHELRYHEISLNPTSTELIKDETCVCVFVNDNLNAEVINALAAKQVKIIALRCAGFNNVDLGTAKAKNIKVVRVPSYSPHAVAEHAVALLLTLNRKTHKAYNRVREGNFSLEKLEGFDLYQKTVGVIGVGKIGKIFINIMKGFGCKILIYDIVQDPELIQKGISYVPLNELFAQSDIISLHCPLNPQTHHLINDSTLKLMKDHVYIINTGRGALIHTEDAIKHLKNGKIGGLALDVYEQESDFFFTDHSSDIINDDVLMRLMTFPNVIITSHQGFFTKEALTQIAHTTFANLKALNNTGVCDNEIK